MLDQITIVLVNPSHPGNIGAAARAMKNMGLSKLSLVNPESFPNATATARAAGADDILAKASVFTSLEDALEDAQLVFATSARTRSLPWPLITPRHAASMISQESQQSSVAICFGRENSGLTNEELALSHYHVNIPTVESYASLNLGAAVQVIAYECYLAMMQPTPPDIERDSPLASIGQVTGLMDQLARVLEQLSILNPKQPKLLLQRLQRLFNRAQLEETEIHILRGILSNIEERR